MRTIGLWYYRATVVGHRSILLILVLGLEVNLGWEQSIEERFLVSWVPCFLISLILCRVSGCFYKYCLLKTPVLILVCKKMYLTTQVPHSALQACKPTRKTGLVCFCAFQKADRRVQKAREEAFHNINTRRSKTYEKPSRASLPITAHLQRSLGGIGGVGPPHAAIQS